MKKAVTLISLSLLSLGSLTAFVDVKPENQNNQNCQHGQCIKLKSDGYQCRNCAQKDSYYCWSHRPRY